ncbi:hypothetical protein SAY87_003465 [Trapa incisa]|uniref:Uncharacterized protein n=1 Tax=Trapa incisa TaxID=236973 RepID=A0AAN7KJ65_9MYRT|nr:hypothetical protein SAY87_003465 [Trapa incisa]
MRGITKGKKTSFCLRFMLGMSMIFLFLYIDYLRITSTQDSFICACAMPICMTFFSSNQSYMHDLESPQFRYHSYYIFHNGATPIGFFLGSRTWWRDDHSFQLCIGKNSC